VDEEDDAATATAAAATPTVAGQRLREALRLSGLGHAAEESVNRVRDAPMHVPVHFVPTLARVCARLYLCVCLFLSLCLSARAVGADGCHVRGDCAHPGICGVCAGRWQAHGVRVRIWAH
jgi:hypothetical protein